VQQPAGGTQREGQAREALRFMFSPSGSMFREFLLGARRKRLKRCCLLHLQFPVACSHAAKSLHLHHSLVMLRTGPSASGLRTARGWYPEAD